jgi:hypothetical protein
MKLKELSDSHELNEMKYKSGTIDDILNPMNNFSTILEEELYSIDESKTLLDFYLKESEFDINVAELKIYMSMQYNQLNVIDLMKKVDVLCKFKPQNDINIILDIVTQSHSYNDINFVFSVIDYLKSLPIKVNITAFSPQDIIGSLILITATGERCLSKHSTLNFNIGVSRKDEVIELITNHSVQLKSYWQEFATQNHTVISAEKALEYKLIDKII